jgi:hypothetical protein
VEVRTASQVHRVAAELIKEGPQRSSQLPEPVSLFAERGDAVQLLAVEERQRLAGPAKSGLFSG